MRTKFQWNSYFMGANHYYKNKYKQMANNTSLETIFEHRRFVKAEKQIRVFRQSGPGSGSNRCRRCLHSVIKKTSYSFFFFEHQTFDSFYSFYSFHSFRFLLSLLFFTLTFFSLFFLCKFDFYVKITKNVLL